MNNELPIQSGSKWFLAALIIVGVFACGIAALIKDSLAPSNSPQIGKEFPPIEASSWINSPAPSGDELRGKVLVVDAWAYWCGPCRMATPMLIHLHEKYKDQQVVFVGLTSEGQDEKSLEQSRKYIESENVTWPNGVGALKTLEALEVDGIPQFWVVDRQNRIAAHMQGWSPAVADELEQAIIQALKAPLNDGRR